MKIMIVVGLTLCLASLVGIGTTFALATNRADDDNVRPFTFPPSDASYPQDSDRETRRKTPPSQSGGG